MAYANAYKRGREEGRAATGVSGECRSEHEQSRGPSARSGPRDARDRVWNSSKPALPRYIFSLYRYIECFCSKRIILAGSRIRKRILRAPRRPPSDASGLTLNLQRGKRPAGPVHGPVCWGPAFLSHATPIAHRPHPRAAAHSPAAHAGRDGGSTLLGRNGSLRHGRNARVVRTHVGPFANCNSLGTARSPNPASPAMSYVAQVRARCVSKASRRYFKTV